MSGLPKGWITIRVQDLFSSFSGGTPSKNRKDFWQGDIPWLSSGDIKTDFIETGSDFITEQALRESSAKLCKQGSVVVVVRSGILKHTLPVSILSREAAINQDIKCFDSGNTDLNRWLALALKNEAKKILALNREGTTVQSVKYETLLNLPLSLPPLEEQNRIVAKLEQLLGKVADCQARLEKIPKLLGRFRQSVLAAACSGRLTADWRAKQTSEPQEIDEILKSLKEKRLRRARTVSSTEKIEEIYSTIETSDSDLLPPSWQYVSLAKLCDSFDYGTSTKSQKEGLVAVLRMGNIQDGNIEWEDLVFTSDPEEIEKYRLKPGTVLFNRTNSPELVGKTAIYRGEQEAIFAGYLIRINNFECLDSEYLNFCLNTSYAREFCSNVKTDGVSQSNINAQKLGTFEIAFCSLTEQKEIVRRVQMLFKYADQLEARYRTAKANVDKLTQSILAKAFRGELVPQDPNDEPASVLLERIRAERAGAASTPKAKPAAKKARTTAKRAPAKTLTQGALF